MLIETSKEQWGPESWALLAGTCRALFHEVPIPSYPAQQKFLMMMIHLFQMSAPSQPVSTRPGYEHEE